MKTFYRTYLPEQIKYNNKIYIYGRKDTNSIKVLVLSRNLRNRTDLYGYPYKPTEHYFQPINETIHNRTGIKTN